MVASTHAPDGITGFENATLFPSSCERPDKKMTPPSNAEITEVTSVRENADQPQDVFEPLEGFTNPAHYYQEMYGGSFGPLLQAPHGYSASTGHNHIRPPSQTNHSSPNIPQPTFTRNGQYIGMPIDAENGLLRKKQRFNRVRPQQKSDQDVAAMSIPPTHTQCPRLQLQTSNNVIPLQWNLPTPAPWAVDKQTVTENSLAGHMYSGSSATDFNNRQRVLQSLHPDRTINLTASPLSANGFSSNGQLYGDSAVNKPSYTRAEAFSTQATNEQGVSERPHNEQLVDSAANNDWGLCVLDILKRLTSMATECGHLRNLVIKSCIPRVSHSYEANDRGALEQSNVQALQYNHNVTDPDEPLRVVFPMGNDASSWCLESVPVTVRQVAGLDHVDVDRLLRAYGADATGGGTVFLHDKIAVYLRVIGASMELIRKVLD